MNRQNHQRAISNVNTWMIGCLIISLTGLLVDLFKVGLDLEERLGLNWLFHIRGTRPAPEKVVIVSTDRQSAYELDIPQEPYKWPRSLHGKLVSRLAAQGARVIVFDIFFKDLGSQEENAKFSAAMREAGNVLLFEKLTLAGLQPNPVRSSIRIPPPEQLANAAAGLASNTFHTDSLLVNQFWLFDPSYPPRASLPFLAFQFYTFHLFEEFLEMIREVIPDEVDRLPERQMEIGGPARIQKMTEDLRAIFTRHPTLGEKLLDKLQNEPSSRRTENTALLTALIRAYTGEDSRFLDFYGPPRTIFTIPYFCVLTSCSPQQLGRSAPFDFSGKVVFVGLSETTQSEQLDRFPTVFASEEGLDFSGVEIAATAFANLLEGRHVTPLPLYLHLLIVLLWGILVGTVFFAVTVTRLAHRSGMLMAAFALSGLGIGVGYCGLVVWGFITHALWFPLVVPLLVQLPVGLFVALFATYRDVNRQRLITEKALADYVPALVVKPLARRIAEISSQGQMVNGICLITDAEGYTKVAEALEESPDKLQVLMNRYFEAVCTSVREQGGIVSDITGDAVLSIWPAGNLSLELRRTVSNAALDLLAAVGQFNKVEPKYALPTRVGLSGGPMFVGNIGTGDHVTYKPLGDIVNTASRIENLNKQLGTRLLASHLVVENLTGFLTRKVGSFQLVGKRRPVVVYELLCRESEADAACQEGIRFFLQGLELFYARHWDQAEDAFQICHQRRGEDGPSHFYAGLCRQYRISPPPLDWEGTIILTAK